MSDKVREICIQNPISIHCLNIHIKTLVYGNDECEIFFIVKEGGKLRTLFFVFLFVVLFICFYKVNTLRIIKVIPLWLFTMLITGLIISSIFMNTNYITKPKKLDSFLSYVVLQNLILPLGILIIINVYIKLKVQLKVSVFILGTVILSIVEMFVEQTGVIKYQHWNVWFSLILWFSVIVVSIAFYHVINSDSLMKRSK